MSKLTISLTPRYKLSIQLVKRQGVIKIAEPLFPSLTQLRKARSGNKISRFFRHIFEHSKIKQFIATPFALMLVANSFVPRVSSFDAQPIDNIVLSSQVENFSTLTDLRYPVETVRITQGYKFYHPGIDFDGITGDPLFAVTSGTVTDVSRSRFGYGNSIIVTHEGGLSTLYAHLSRIDVTLGQHVTGETKIGEMGATGNAFGDHLHFEVRDENGKAINPLSILPH